MQRRNKEKPKTVFHALAGVFYPMSHNGHRPHLLRGTTLFIVSSISIFLLGASYARFQFLHGSVLGEEVVSSVLIDLTNQTRIKYDQSPLVKNDKLELASTLKATDMAHYQYFAHNSPTGVTPWHWMKEAGYNFMYAGENLAIDFTQSNDVETAWLKSPTHRANILNRHFTEIGVSTKEGTFNGHKTIYVVQMFGTPVPGDTESQSTKPLANSKEIQPKNQQSEITAENNSSTKEKSTVGEVLGTEKIKASLNTTTSATETPILASTEGENRYQVLAEDKDSIVVANRENLINTAGTSALTVDQILLQSEVKTYSTFWQKFIYKFWFELNSAYKLLTILITVSLIFLLFAEFRRRHYLHMLYGTSTILFLFLLVYLNQGLW